MTTLARLNVLIGADAKGLEKALKSASKKMEDAGRRMRHVGRTLSTTITLPMAAVGAASIKMASDAEEAANKFDVVMGASADRVREKLKALHSTIPLTTAEMEGMSAGIQDLLVPMGVMRSEAADMSVGMVELAGDLASFNNVLPTEALMAMRSALAGESEPMRRFGVDTRVARLEALALEEGLIDVGEKLDETARAQAVMLAIQRDSTDAMGDAARTVDSTANSMKFLARDVKELGITIGQILIPVVRPMLEHMKDAVAVFAEMEPKTQKVVLAIGAFAAAIGPLLVVLGALTSAVGTLAGALVSLNVIAGVQSVAAFVALAGSIRSLGSAAALLSMMHPAGWLALGMAALAPAALAVADNWSTLAYEGGRLADRLMNKLAPALQAVRDNFNALRRDPPSAWLPEAVGVDPNDQSRTSWIYRREAAMRNAPPLPTPAPPRPAPPTVSGFSVPGQVTDNANFLAVPQVEKLAAAWQGTWKNVELYALRTGEAAEQTEVLAGIGESFASSFANAIADAAQNGMAAFRRFADFVIAQLTRLIAKFLVFKLISGIFGPASGIAQSFGQNAGFIPRAMGGPVQAGRPYLVGERGPELMIPGASGSIVPNHALQGAGGPPVVFDFSRMPPPRDPLSAARDRDWMEFFGETVKAFSGNGGKFR